MRKEEGWGTLPSSASMESPVRNPAPDGAVLTQLPVQELLD